MSEISEEKVAVEKGGRIGNNAVYEIISNSESDFDSTSDLDLSREENDKRYV